MQLVVFVDVQNFSVAVHNDEDHAVVNYTLVAELYSIDAKLCVLDDLLRVEAVGVVRGEELFDDVLPSASTDCGCCIDAAVVVVIQRLVQRFAKTVCVMVSSTNSTTVTIAGNSSLHICIHRLLLCLHNIPELVSFVDTIASFRRSFEVVPQLRVLGQTAGVPALDHALLVLDRSHSEVLGQAVRHEVHGLGVLLAVRLVFHWTGGTGHRLGRVHHLGTVRLVCRISAIDISAVTIVTIVTAVTVTTFTSVISVTVSTIAESDSYTNR